MSGFYTGVNAQLLAWALGDRPDEIKLRVATVSDAYVFEPAHTAEQITGVLDEQDLVGAINDSTVVANALTVTGLTPGVVIQGFVFFFAWEGGAKPICFVNQATDLNLPYLAVSSQIDVRFPSTGIFRI